VNAWGINARAGNAATLTRDFKAPFEIACQYRTARETADNHREFNFLSEQDATIEKTNTPVFCDSLPVLLGEVRANVLIAELYGPGRLMELERAGWCGLRNSIVRGYIPLSSKRRL
jgi:hypothetical protein